MASTNSSAAPATITPTRFNGVRCSTTTWFSRPCSGAIPRSPLLRKFLRTFGAPAKVAQPQRLRRTVGAFSEGGFSERGVSRPIDSLQRAFLAPVGENLVIHRNRLFTLNSGQNWIRHV